MYAPPFTITSTIVNLAAEISAQIERYADWWGRCEEQQQLRRDNRIKTIHSSLAIEGNTLSEDEVRDIIEGRNIVAPIKQIQEVKNAIKTYELYSSLNPFEVKDLLIRSCVFHYEFEFIHPIFAGKCVPLHPQKTAFIQWNTIHHQRCFVLRHV